MERVRIRGLVAAASLVVLAGCGRASGMADINGGAAQVAAPTTAPVATAPASTATATPAAVTATPAPVRRPAPVSRATAPPATQVMVPLAFAIIPLFPLGAAGTVTVARTSAGVHYRVSVHGLVPGSVHTIHDHLGRCTSANTSTHLAVLATATADSQGVILFDTTVPAFDFGAGRIVIVYDSARPISITGCATL